MYGPTVTYSAWIKYREDIEEIEEIAKEKHADIGIYFEDNFLGTITDTGEFYPTNFYDCNPNILPYKENFSDIKENIIIKDPIRINLSDIKME